MTTRTRIVALTLGTTLALGGASTAWAQGADPKEPARDGARLTFVCENQDAIATQLAGRAELLAGSKALTQKARAAAVEAGHEKAVERIDRRLARIDRAMARVAERTTRFEEVTATRC